MVTMRKKHINKPLILRHFMSFRENLIKVRKRKKHYFKLRKKKENVPSFVILLFLFDDVGENIFIKLSIRRLLDISTIFIMRLHINKYPMNIVEITTILFKFICINIIYLFSSVFVWISK